MFGTLERSIVVIALGCKFRTNYALTAYLISDNHRRMDNSILKCNNKNIKRNNDTHAVFVSLTSLL